MKTARDPRHLKRISQLKKLFALSFRDTKPNNQQLKVFEHQEEIDAILRSVAPQWPLSKIAKIDLAILRLAVFELIIVKKEPPKVIIDEAVELAKEFGNDASSSFINGVLGTILKKNIK